MEEKNNGKFSYPEDVEKVKAVLSSLPEEMQPVIVVTFFQFMSFGLF